MHKRLNNWMSVLIVLALLLTVALLIVVNVDALTIKDGLGSGTGIVINVSIGANSEMVDSCKILDVENRTYYLTENLQSAGTCFVVKANNVNIDGQGHSIVGESKSGKYAIKAADVSGLVVENLMVGGYQYAIFLDDVKNSTISEVSVNNQNSIDSGIKLRASDYNIVRDSSFNGGKYGIDVLTSKYNLVTNNLVSGVKYGVSVGISQYNNVENNTIRNSSYGLYVYQSTANEFSNDLIEANKVGFYASQSIQNRIIDSLINSTDSDLSLQGSSNSNELLNTLFESTNIEAGSNIVRSWHVMVSVRDPMGLPIEGAHVSVLEGNRYLQFSDLTDLNGKVNEKLIEYSDNGRRKVYNDYSLFASKEGYENKSIDFDLNGNVEINVTLGKSIVIGPSGIVITNVTLSPALPLVNNGSSQDIVIDFDSSVYPINVSLILFNVNGSIFDSVSDRTIENKSMLPFVYVLPELPDGSYAINFTFKDSNGNFTVFTIGSMEVLKGAQNNTGNNQTDNNQTSGNETNTGGSGSGSGGGGHGGSGSSRNVINLTDTDVGSVNTDDNQTGNETVNGEIKGGTTITGAIIGALDRAKVPLIWAFIVVVVILYLIAATKQRPEDQKDGKEKKNAKSK